MDKMEKKNCIHCNRIDNIYKEETKSKKPLKMFL